ncbi:LuxR C-terminal-related transcriptional regulator, partial [Actinoplanes sp. NPDC049596]|uniref:LuxR C-terminal-related transcriptional regulator n=1 Tax=Actinoplanes sp. NPDC049596 TaxID=3154625 RepID=UPI00343775CA
RPANARPGDDLLDSLAVARTDGYDVAAPLVLGALRAFRGSGAGGDDQAWLWLAGMAAADVWDDETWAVVTARHVHVARAQGDLSSLPLTLSSLACVEIFAGEHASAASRVAEIEAIGEATGVALAPYGALTVAAWRGDEAVAGPLIEAALADVVARGEAAGVLLVHWARSVLLNGLARYQEAVTAARAAAAHPIHSALAYWALSELVEAAVRSGDRDTAADAYRRLEVTASAAGTDGAVGALARAGALVAEGEAADALYRRAIEHLGRTRIRTDLARCHLLYGEWLRRENHRRAARGQLRLAYDMLAAAGAGAFAERARHELAAAGAPVAERAARISDALTGQEAHIARLAGRGLTNAEIGAQLFLSPHTVEWHLRKVFTKLGITSRRQLRPSETG